MGAVVILVIASMLLPAVFSPLLQKLVPYFILFFSLLVVVPLVSLRLYRLDNINKIIGWTFIGLGAEFVVFPVPLLILVLIFPSTDSLVIGGVLLTSSVVLGVPAGLTSIVIGGFILKRRSLQYSPINR